MTRQEREAIVWYAFEGAMRRLDGDRAILKFSEQCMKAIIGAAALLDRDPLALADLLADGRLAEYIEAAESTIPLALDDPAPIRASMEELLQDAANLMTKERELLDRRFARILKTFDRTADDLRRRGRQKQSWHWTWFNVQSFMGLDSNWTRQRGLAPEEAGGELK